MWVEVDTGVCIGAGHCALTAPDVFSQRDEDGVVVLLRREVDDSATDGLAADVETAVSLCPSRAISTRS